MRSASAALQAFFATRQSFWSADLYEIDLSNGQTLFLTTSNDPIILEGVSYLAVGPQIKRGSWTVTYTQEVPSLSFSIYSNGVDFVDSKGAPFNLKQGAHEGLFDYAYIKLQRVFLPTFGTDALGSVLLFGGRTARITINALGVDFTAKGDNVLMQQYMPKNTYQLGCIHMLYDAGCSLSRANFTVQQPIGAGNINNIFLPWSTAPSNPGYYAQGVVEIMSGQGEGQSRSILSSNANGISLAYPLYQIPSAGDVMSVSQGCVKNLSACTNQFSNSAHYRGFPYIPPAETAF